MEAEHDQNQHDLNHPKLGEQAHWLDALNAGTAYPDVDPVRQAIEAILLVVDSPVAAHTLAQVLEVPTADVTAVLQELASDYERQGRGFSLREAGNGWRLFTRPECAPYVERFVSEGMITRLTGAAMETLAVVAYRQPVTRSQIAGIRGVNVDGVMRTLLTRGLIQEQGSEASTGAHFYGTTPYFLERLGLTSVEQLPQIVPHLHDLDGLDEAAAQQQAQRASRASVNANALEQGSGFAGGIESPAEAGAHDNSAAATGNLPDQPDSIDQAAADPTQQHDNEPATSGHMHIDLREREHTAAEHG